jgi:hypothetical protein
MMKKKTLILHIGTPKAGSSFIQQVLNRNFQTLLQTGFRYVRANVESNGAHHSYAKNWQIDTWQTAVKEILEGSEPTACLSSEYFYGMAAEDVHQVARYLSTVEGLDVNVICFIRPQHTFLSSQYGQYLKGPDQQGTASYGRWLKNGGLKKASYVGRLAAWSKAFGQHAVTIADYESMKGDSLVVPILRLAGIDEKSVSISTELSAGERNISLGPVALGLVREVNRVLQMDRGSFNVLLHVAREMETYQVKIDVERDFTAMCLLLLNYPSFRRNVAGLNKAYDAKVMQLPGFLTYASKVISQKSPVSPTVSELAALTMLIGVNFQKKISSINQRVIRMRNVQD